MFNIIYFLTLLCISPSKYIYSDAKIINVDPTLSKILNLTGKTEKDLPSDYETIQIWYPKNGMTLQFHGKSHFSFYAFGKNITSKLEPIQFDLIGEKTPVWLGNWNNRTFTLKQLHPYTIQQEFLWYATSNNTVIGTGFDDGVAYFVGKVGNMSMVPLNKEESQKLRRRKRDIDNELLPGTEDPTGSFLLSDYHKIYISSEEDNVDFSDTIKTSLDEKAEVENVKSLKRTKRDPTDQQEIIQPQILLYVDYGSQFVETKGLLFNRFIMYLISFWNNVNVYFQHLKNPQVSLRITGIIIAMNTPAVPFFLKNHVGFDEIVCKESLSDMNLWFNDHQHIIPKDTYDIAITMTNQNLFQSGHHRRVKVDGAVRSSIDCQENQLNMNMTAIVRDINFSGIPVAVKELTYLMNAGYKPSLSLDKNICNLHDGEIFYVQNSSYSFHYQNPQDMLWFRCSKSIWPHSTEHGEPVCGYKKHFLDTGKPLPNILPGEISTLDEQCQLLGHQQSCEVHGYFDCNGFLWCKVRQLRYFSFLTLYITVCKNVGLILDGTPCGENKYCYGKKCVPYVRNMWIQKISDKN